jgi:hypothetical protein
VTPSCIAVVFLIAFAASCSSTIGVDAVPAAAGVPSNETLQTWLSQTHQASASAHGF